MYIRYGYRATARQFLLGVAVLVVVFVIVGILLDNGAGIDSLRHPERYPLVIKRNALDFV